ncbi:MAG: ADP-ribose diphosphatase [Pseudomonadota bacterium]|nr:ADP-ribose diphosphatase [Pseudomonadota bacterium]
MNYRYEILNKAILYRGFFTLEEYRLRHDLFAGGQTPEIRRECLERGHAVAVLPYDPIRDQVVLVEQFRIGALEFPGGPWLLEVVAGMIGDGESRLEVARRETMEEAGCELLDLVHICDYMVSPGGTSESIAVYCGRVDASAAGGIFGLADEHEDIRVQVISRREAEALVHSGRINSASPLIALQWLELNHQSLRARWT